MKRRDGFTSLELIVVLEIIGVLAVVAMLIFFNIQSNARQVAIESLKGAMENAASVVHGKASLVGVEHLANASVFEIDTAYGYPSIKGIVNAVENFHQDWIVIERITVHDDVVSVSFKDLEPMAQSRCYLTYKEAVSPNTRPRVEVFCNE